MARRVLCLLCLVLLFAGDASGQSQQPTAGKQTDQRAEQQPSREREASDANQRSERGASARPQPGTSQSGSEREQESERPLPPNAANIPAWLTALAAVASAGFAGVLAFFNWRLWKETKRTAEAALLSAETAKATSDDYTRSERAWVGLARVEARKIINVDTQTVEAFAFSFCWRNAGKSPALRIDAMANSQIIPAGAKLDMDTIKRKTGDEESASLVPGGESMGPARRHTLQELIDVAKGRSQLILWGLVHYETIFEQFGRRETEEAVCVEIAHGGANTLAAPRLIADQFSYRSYGPNNHAT